ncbi:NIF3L1 family protein [Megaselia abdita]
MTGILRKMSGRSLKSITKELERFAPLKYAESWDNVGVLLEPFTERTVKTILLTNDLTENVVKEGIEKNAELIISYHPPIFASLKRITNATWKERIVSQCLENRIAIYSPHTAWDFVNNGVNDWLANALPYSTKEPIKTLPEVSEFVGGTGRLLSIDEDLCLRDAIEKVKIHAGIKSVNVAIGKNQNIDSSQIKSVAICAGSGASVFKGVKADLYLTGEMSHHEVLDAQEKNISVILCNHSNSERGYLKEFKQLFHKMIPESEVKVLVSEVDKDPLESY